MYYVQTTCTYKHVDNDVENRITRENYQLIFSHCQPSHMPEGELYQRYIWKFQILTVFHIYVLVFVFKLKPRMSLTLKTLKCNTSQINQVKPLYVTWRVWNKIN